MTEIVSNITILPENSQSEGLIGNVYLSLAISPTGHIYLYSDENQESVPTAVADKIRSFFALNDIVGLLRLGLTNFSATLPSSLSFWQKFIHIFIAQTCKLNSLDEQAKLISLQIPFPLNEINRLIEQAPFIRGIEYLNQEMAEAIWQNLTKALIDEIKPFDGKVTNYFSAFHAAWNTVGRICFHLAENKTDLQFPFAFLATYTTSISKSAQAQHLPLQRALEEYASSSKKALLLALLLPIQKAAEKSDFIRKLVDSGAIFQPLAWKAKDAYQFLHDIPLLEAAGVMVRVPNWWNPKKPPRPSITVAIGNQNVSTVGLDALLDFNMYFALPSGEQLTRQEFEKILSTEEQLIQIKGQWIQVDNDKLNQVITHWTKIEQQVKQEGLTFAQGLRLLAGVSKQHTEQPLLDEVSSWSTVVEGTWLSKTLSHLRHPEVGEKKLKATLLQYLKTQLRPYQQQGVQWLWWLYNMHLGGCLADDMGLGKTIQVLSLLLLAKHHTKKKGKQQPHLLVLPASLLGNWQSEINRFAPSLNTWIAHSSASRKEMDNMQEEPTLRNVDLVITTYTTMLNLSWITKTSWDMVILDEAQAIKNPTTKQTQAAKAITSNVRFILTGTPIENRLLDLWSLFDFIAPGLLGSSRIFADYGKQQAKQESDSNRKSNFYASIRRLVSPYILRRLKSDKHIISDLLDKVEMQTYCTLTKQQAGLYQQAVNDLKQKLNQQVDGIQRRGLVLSYLLHFKQICNHPHQWLGHGQYDVQMSGKFKRLKELCEIIAQKQEKVLIFTQFREIIPPLCDFLSLLFGREGFSLHGKTAINKRSKLVEAFQQEQGASFFVLSLKAGGTGLNLTAASHVIHFDRWWNPAVENQATDRAYRIGQKKNVLVHKFICQGTIEEKIDSLISSKKSLVDEVISDSSEKLLTELSDEELLNIVTLDIHRALSEN